MHAVFRGAKRFRFILELALVAALVLGVRAYQQRDAARGPAPELSAESLGGERVSLDEYRGRPVVVHFWASWCGVCRAMEDNVDSGEVAGVPIVRVATRSGGAEAVRAYLAERGESLDAAAARTILLDDDGAIARRYGVGAFPTTFWLDAEGQIRHVEVGYTTSVGLALRALLSGA